MSKVQFTLLFAGVVIVGAASGLVTLLVMLWDRWW